jgi:hypothetical protein
LGGKMVCERGPASVRRIELHAFHTMRAGKARTWIEWAFPQPGDVIVKRRKFDVGET